MIIVKIQENKLKYTFSHKLLTVDVTKRDILNSL